MKLNRVFLLPFRFHFFFFSFFLYSAVTEIVKMFHENERIEVLDENSNTIILNEKILETTETILIKQNAENAEKEENRIETKSSDQINGTGDETCAASLDDNTVTMDEQSNKNGVVDVINDKIDDETEQILTKLNGISEIANAEIDSSPEKAIEAKETGDEQKSTEAISHTDAEVAPEVATVECDLKSDDKKSDNSSDLIVNSSEKQQQPQEEQEKNGKTEVETTPAAEKNDEQTSDGKSPTKETKNQKSVNGTKQPTSTGGKKSKGDSAKKQKQKTTEIQASNEAADSTPNKSIVKNIYEPSQANADDAQNQYGLFVSERQRKYYLKGQKDSSKMPPDECEIFCSNIPCNVLESDLIPLFERYGTIWHLRLLMKANNPKRNAGYSFIRFMDANAAHEAAKNLNNYEIVPGKNLSVKQSKPNLCLFVGNIHRAKTKEQIQEKFSRITSGLVKSVVKSSFYEESKNCGFCFLQYDSHSSAYIAKRKLDNAQTKVWGRQLFVDWSDRRLEPDAEQLKNTKTLFVNNLPKTVTTELLKEKFQVFGEVGQVTIIKDYAFVLFKNREDALQALQKFDVMELNDKNVEISLAISKPVQITKYGYRENYHLRYVSKRFRGARGAGIGFGGQHRFNKRTLKPMKIRKQN